MSPADSPWPWIIGCLIAGAVCAIVWLSGGSPRWRNLAAGCLLACPAFWLLDQLVATDRERIEESLRRMVEAFRAEDQSAAEALLSSQAILLRRAVPVGMATVDIVGQPRVTDVIVPALPGDGTGRSYFRLNARFRVAGMEHYEPTRWLANWRFEDGTWKMAGITEIDPITGAPRDRIDKLLNVELPKFVR